MLQGMNSYEKNWQMTTPKANSPWTYTYSPADGGCSFLCALASLPHIFSLFSSLSSPPTLFFLLFSYFTPRLLEPISATWEIVPPTIGKHIIISVLKERQGQLGKMTQWLYAKYSALWAEIIEVIRADKFKSSPYYHDSIYAFFYIYIFL